MGEHVIVWIFGSDVCAQQVTSHLRHIHTAILVAAWLFLTCNAKLWLPAEHVCGFIFVGLVIRADVVQHVM